MGDPNPHGEFQGHGHGREEYERYHDRFGERGGWAALNSADGRRSKPKIIAIVLFIVLGIGLIVLGYVLAKKGKNK